MELPFRADADFARNRKDVTSSGALTRPDQVLSDLPVAQRHWPRTRADRRCDGRYQQSTCSCVRIRQGGEVSREPPVTAGIHLTALSLPTMLSLQDTCGQPGSIADRVGAASPPAQHHPNGALRRGLDKLYYG